MEVKVVARALAGARGLARGAAGRGSRAKHLAPESGDIQQLALSTQSALDLGLQGGWKGRQLQPVLGNVEQHRSRVAISDVQGDYLYEDLYLRSWDLAKGLVGLLGQAGPAHRVAFLCSSGLPQVLATWACWLAGYTAVPLCPASSPARLEHQLVDSACSLVVTTRDQADRLLPTTRQHGLKLIALDDTWWTAPKEPGDQSEPLPPPLVEEGEGAATALLLYTAGATTGAPRGVLIQHHTLAHQIEHVVDAWAWGPTDSVLHCLPLSSHYGLVSSLQAPLATGARVTMMPQFDPLKVWSHLLGVGPVPRVTAFPGLPGIYTKLLAQAEESFKDKKTQDYVKTGCSKRVRVMMSGGAPLPPDTAARWTAVTGHRILDNYVSTEAGTALSSRVAGGGKVVGPGCRDCGAPTQGTRTRVVRFRDHTKSSYDILASGSVEGTDVVEPEESAIGELLLKGEHVARHYWAGGAQVSIEGKDAWLETGDIVQVHQGCYRVRGRLGMDTLTTRGGQQVNLRAVERKLLSCPDITDCSVLGLGESSGDQRVAAVVTINPSRKVSVEDLLRWCGDSMAEAEVPTVFRLVKEIGRDSSGHVDKLRLAELFPDTELVSFHDKKM